MFFLKVHWLALESAQEPNSLHLKAGKEKTGIKRFVFFTPVQAMPPNRQITDDGMLLFMDIYKKEGYN